jgi:hypothetical protein
LQVKETGEAGFSPSVDNGMSQFAKYGPGPNFSLFAKKTAHDPTSNADPLALHYAADRVTGRVDIRWPDFPGGGL